MGSVMRLVSSLVLVLGLSIPGGAAVVSGRAVPATVAGANEPVEVRAQVVPFAANAGWAAGVLEGRASAPAAAATTAGPAGRFVIEAPRSGVWSVEVGAEGLVPMRLAPLAAVEAVELPPVHMVRDIGVEIEVRDNAGAPVPGAWVMAVCTDRAWWRRVATDGWRVGARIGRTDTAGRLRLPMAEGEPLEVHAFGPAGEEARADAAGGIARLVLASTGSGGRLLEVVEPGGRPAAGIIVVTGDVAWPAGRTGDDGRLRLAVGGSSSTRLMLLAPDGRQLMTKLGPGDEPARLVLPALERVHGAVLSAGDHRPLARAVVVPAPDPGAFVLTRGDGSFELPRPVGGRLPIRIRAAGHLPARAVIEGDEQSRRLSLALAAGAEGIVVDGRGAPIEGVELGAADRAGRGQLGAVLGDHVLCRAVSDRGGRFSLGCLDPGRVLDLQADATGYATTSVRLGGLKPGLERGGLRVVLEHERAARGLVVDPNQQPVSGAELRLQEETGTPGAPRPGPGRSEPAATSDAQGRFSVRLVPGRPTSIEVTARGFAPLVVRGVRIDPGNGPADLGALTLAPGSAIKGVVTTDGEPAAGAGVWLDPSLDAPSSSRGRKLQEDLPVAVADQEGRFRIDDLEQGRGFNVLVARDGLVPAWALGVEAGSSRPITIEMDAAARVTGRVVAEDGGEEGDGVAGARVDLRADAPADGTLDAELLALGLGGGATTDGDGRFTIAGLASGRAVIEAGAAGFRPSEPVHVELEPGETVKGIELVLGRGATLQGRVSSDPDGQPIEGVTISVDRVSTVTDADGAYRLQGLAEGAQTVALQHPQYGRRVFDVEVRPPLSTRDFTLTGRFTVEGRVIDPDGYPIEGAEIGLRSVGPQTPTAYRSATGPDGRFSVPGVAAATYDVEAGAPGHATTVMRSGARVLTGPVRDLEIVLEPGTMLGGQVLGLDPGDLAQVTVDATSSSGQLQRAVVDAAGAYEIADLGPGEWLVRARLPGGAREADARVSVQQGDRRLSRDLDLSGGITLTGTVMNGGEPLPGTSVSLEGRDTAIRRTTITDHDGRFRLEGLDTGRYGLGLLNQARLVTDSRELDLRHDDDLMIEIDTVELTGRVLSATTRDPVAGARVNLYHLLEGQDGPRSVTSVATGEDGRFGISRLTAGFYRLTVQAEGYALHEEPLELEAYAPPEQLEILLERAGGLWLAVGLASGGRPGLVQVSLLNASGGRLALRDRAQVRSDGLAHLPSVPPGTWTMLVTASGTAPARVVATAPGPPTDVVLQPGSALSVRVPGLAELNLVGTLTLLDASGQRFLGLDASGMPCSSWQVPGGTTVVEGVPPGSWTAAVTSPDGRSWQGSITTSGRATELVLDDGCSR